MHNNLDEIKSPRKLKVRTKQITKILVFLLTLFVFKETMNRPRLEVPRELTSLLLDFTVNVLLEKPGDLVDYAVGYFTKLRDEGRTNNRDQSVPQTSVTCEEETLTDDEEMEEPPVRSKDFKFCMQLFFVHM